MSKRRAATNSGRVTWYTWLEQARPISASRSTLERIGQALQLNATDAAYLFSLAAVTASSYCFADALFRFDDDQTPLGRNHARRLFMDPKRRKLYLDWEDIARGTVGVLRLRHGTRQSDPSLEALLTALRGASRDFSRLWDENRTLPLQSATVRMRHQLFGTIKVATLRFLLPADPDCFLATLPPADPKTRCRVCELRQWSTEAVQLKTVGPRGRESGRSRLQPEITHRAGAR